VKGVSESVCVRERGRERGGRGVCVYRNVRIASVALGIRGREYGEHKQESAHNLCAQAGADAVARVHEVHSSPQAVEGGDLESFHQTCTADGPQALRHHVQQRPN
jgi:hypothetical protein